MTGESKTQTDPNWSTTTLLTFCLGSMTWSASQTAGISQEGQRESAQSNSVPVLKECENKAPLEHKGAPSINEYRDSETM